MRPSLNKANVVNLANAGSTGHRVMSPNAIAPCSEHADSISWSKTVRHCATALVLVVRVSLDAASVVVGLPGSTTTRVPTWTHENKSMTSYFVSRIQPEEMKVPIVDG